MESNATESFSDRVLRDMSSAVLVLDRKGYIRYFNQPAMRIFELDVDLVSGTQRFTAPEDRDENQEFYNYVFDAFRMKEYTHAGHAHYCSPSGKQYMFRLSTSFVDNPGLENDYIVVTINDETREEALKRKNNNVNDISWDNNTRNLLIHTPLADFPGGVEPEPNTHIMFDRRPMKITSVVTNMGVLGIYLTALDPREY